MKTTIVLFFLMAVSLASFSQKVDRAWLEKEFGERFISATVIGFPENTAIPFTENDLRYDKLSWIFPIEMNGVCVFQRVQARYNLNEVQENDTLSLDIAEKIISTVQKSGKNFPDNQDMIFFITKSPSAKQPDFKKTIAYDNDEKLYSIIDLSKDAKIASNGDTPSYLTESKEAVMLITLKNEKIEELGSVMTLVGLEPSQ